MPVYTVITAHRHLARQPGGRLEPREHDRGDAQREDDVAPPRVLPELDGIEERVDVEERREAEHDQEHLQGQVGDDERGDPIDAGGREAAHVAHRDVQHDREADDELACPPVADRRVERRQVVRRRERGDRDQDDVVEQDRPAGDEAHELVEGEAREDRRAGAVLVEARALDVGHRRHHEEHAGGEEHERREGERAVGHDAQREVDGAGDRGVDDREERR
jgi:hypothetical protein